MSETIDPREQAAMEMEAQNLIEEQVGDIVGEQSEYFNYKDLEKFTEMADSEKDALKKTKHAAKLLKELARRLSAESCLIRSTTPMELYSQKTKHLKRHLGGEHQVFVEEALLDVKNELLLEKMSDANEMVRKMQAHVREKFAEVLCAATTDFGQDSPLMQKIRPYLSTEKQKEILEARKEEKKVIERLTRLMNAKTPLPEAIKALTEHEVAQGTQWTDAEEVAKMEFPEIAEILKKLVRDQQAEWSKEAQEIFNEFSQMDNPFELVDAIVKRVPTATNPLS